VNGRAKSSDVVRTSCPQLIISHKALGTLSEDDNIMPKRVGDTIHN
jgi:hypothetical protein